MFSQSTASLMQMLSQRHGYHCFVLIFTVGLQACSSPRPQFEGTTPFTAAQRRAAEHRWQFLLQKARRALADERNDEDTIRQHVDTLRMLKDRSLRNGKLKPSLHTRRRIAALIADYEHRVQRPANLERGLELNRRENKQFRWPLTPVRIISFFGLRTDPFERSKRTFHDGIDLAAPAGTPVYASGAGSIVEAGWRDDGCGLSVTVAHSGDFQSEFCHLGKVLVQVGDNVSRESIIGTVGNTGRSTGHHLHWGVRHSGLALDPTILVGKRP